MEIIYIVVVILLSLGAFLIFRAFWLWYWKIDKIVDLLEKIDKNTRKVTSDQTLSQLQETVEDNKENAVEGKTGKKKD